MPEIIVKLGDQIVQKHYLSQDKISIGRSSENDISVENLAVSRHHANVIRVNGTYYIEDLDSSNGSFVNGVRVTKTELANKDVIAIGKHELYFYNQDVPAVSNPIDMVEKTMIVSHAPKVTALLRVTRGKHKDAEFVLDKAETRIGRAADNDIRLTDWFVSKYHALIVRKGLVFAVRDLDSWRHTYVNGEEVEEHTLKPGDTIQLGPKIQAVFDVPESADSVEGSGRTPVEVSQIPANGIPDEEPLPLGGNSGMFAAPEPEPAPEPEAWAQPELAAEFEPAGSNIDKIAPEPMSTGSSHAEMFLQEEASFRDVSDEDFGDDSQNSSQEIFGEGSDGEILPSDEEEESRAPLDTDSAIVQAVHSMSHVAESLTDEELNSSLQDPDMAPDQEDDAISLADSNSESQAEVLSINDESEADDPATMAFGEAVLDLDAEGEQAVAFSDSADVVSLEASEQSEVYGESLEVQASDEDFVADDSDQGWNAEAGAGNTEAASEVDHLVDSVMQELDETQGLDRKEIEMWVKALHNPSQIIRKQAQRKLEKLTGQVYDIE